jgi:lysozyme
MRGTKINWNPAQVFVPDLSHYEWPCNFVQLADSGCVGVIYKATEGSGYQDPTFQQARAACYASGMLWGSYHFTDASDLNGQIDNYLAFAMPTSEDLICLDFEDNGSNSMSLPDAQAWVQAVEDNLQRPNQCVFYSGNRIKDTLGNNPSPFLAAHRLWIAQYGGNATIPDAWASWWLWQFTDGSTGPEPHQAAGCPTCDMNAYQSDETHLKLEWASGIPSPS